MNQEKYIGMDVHQATISVAVRDSSGKLIMECILETKAATILEFIAGLRGTLSLTFEEGTSAAWLHDLLKPHVSHLVVCDPRRNALLKDGSNGDRIDARKLAELLHGNKLHAVYHGEHGLRTLKELGRSYLTITNGSAAAGAPGSTTRSARGEPQAPCREITATDSFDRSDSCRLAGGIAANATPFPYQATAVGLQWREACLREAHIGIGCALENLILAAAATGYTASLTLLPAKLTAISDAPTLKLLAHIDLVRGQKQQSQLYDAIPHRHTNRNPYFLNPLPTDFVDGVRQLVSDEINVKLFLFSAEADRSHIVGMISKANDVVYADPQVDQASKRWVRMKWSEVQKFRDGLIVDEFGEPPLTAAIQKFTSPALMRFALKHRLVQRISYTEVLHATPLFGIIAVRDRYDQEQCLRAGRVWQRAHLLATAHGLAGRPVNEAVEWIDHQRMRNEEPQAMAALCERTYGRQELAANLHVSFRLARPQVSPSPRRPVEDVVL